MCGISGFVSTGLTSVDTLKRATDVIRHRGPDDEGYAVFSVDAVSAPAVFGGPDTPRRCDGEQPPWFPSNDSGVGSGVVGLGHRRLSILDLSPFGHQPMSYGNGRYWITYNGEVYNYLELRDELASLGHKFITRTDTEVILAAYSQWGDDCLRRFNGMWAFAIFDRKEGKVFLARDRFGVKPLYYWVSPDGTLFFGSEIKQFTTVPGWDAVLNEQRAYDFLVWGVTDHTDETLFRGVYQIPPGYRATMMVNERNRSPGRRIQTTQWYNLPAGRYGGTFEEAADDFRNLLSQSVRLRLRSDVPVGSCLSGGLDSSSIVCLMNDILSDEGANSRQKTFSALSRVEKYNEKKWIDSVIAKTGADDHSVHPDMDGLFDIAGRMTWHQDEPFGSTSIYAQWNVFESAAKNDVRVMLDGQGADEQLFGYHGSMGVRFGTLFRTGRWVRLIREIVLVHEIHGYSYQSLLSQFASAVLPPMVQSVLRRIAGRTIPDPDWINWDGMGVNRVSPFRGSEKSVRDHCRSQMTSTNLQMLLHWEDRDSMAHSIESRVPFLDYRLAEFSMSLPDDFKTRDGVTKRVLRSAMTGVIPDNIRDRMDKIGFATPEEVWVRETAPDVFRRKMKESVENSRGVLNENGAAFLEDIIAGRKPFSFVVWRMINFGEWMKLFSVRVAGESNVVN